MREKRHLYRVLAWNPEGKRSLGRPRRRWELNIKMDLVEIEMVWFSIRSSGVLLYMRQ
jgi:hypothetical protein